MKTIEVNDLDLICSDMGYGIVYERLCDSFCYNHFEGEELTEISIEEFWKIVGEQFDSDHGDGFLLGEDDGSETEEERAELLEACEDEFTEMYFSVIEECKNMGITHIKVNSRFV